MANKRMRFAECRKAKGTQSKVATDLDISEVYVRMIENGTFTPGRDLMFRITSYFEQPLESLFPELFESQLS